MKKLDEILSKLTYVIIMGLSILLVFVRPVQLNSQSVAIPPAFAETPLIWWPVDYLKVYIAFGIVMVLLLYYRRVFLTQWPGRHIVTVAIAVLAFVFAYIKTTDSYIAGYPDRLEISHPMLAGKDIEALPMRKIAEVRLSCNYKTVRGRVLIEPSYKVRLADGRDIDLFSSYKGNNRDKAILGIAHIDEAIRKNGVERLAAEENGPGTSSFNKCSEEIKDRITPESYDLFQKFMVKTADTSTYLRTL